MICLYLQFTFLQDIIADYDVNQSNSEEKPENKTNQSLNDSSNTGVDNSNQYPNPDYYPTLQPIYNYVISHNERLLIAQQMRQHIQLLTQMALLTSKDQQWLELHQDCRKMLTELMTRSFSQQYSIYAQDNLFPSMKVNKCTYLLTTPFKNQKSRQLWCWSVKCTFLESSWYTEAKKIPEKLIYRRHLACFFQNKILQKIFFG